MTKACILCDYSYTKTTRWYVIKTETGYKHQCNKCHGSFITYVIHTPTHCPFPWNCSMPTGSSNMMHSSASISVSSSGISDSNSTTAIVERGEGLINGKEEEEEETSDE